MQEKIAINLSEDETIIVSREEAIWLFNLYESRTLTHHEDIQLHTALQLALGAGRKQELVYAENEETWAARKLREWKSDAE